MYNHQGKRCQQNPHWLKWLTLPIGGYPLPSVESYEITLPPKVGKDGR